MAAMDAADANGGDHRCNCGNNATPELPCDNKTAHVAYIAIANKDDMAGVTHNDGKYYAFITAYDNELKKGESANPVKTLRMRYDAWVKGRGQADGSARPDLAVSRQTVPALYWLRYCPPRPPRCGGFFNNLY